MKFNTIDKLFIGEMRAWGVPALRISLGIVFLWFGLLKVFGVSPVADLVTEVYLFLPRDFFLMILGIWEAIIGIGLLFKITLRLMLALLWLQMAGTFFALVLSPTMFFTNGNLLLLTIEGEFVIKNIVLITASIVIGGYEVKSKS